MDTVKQNPELWAQVTREKTITFLEGFVLNVFLLNLYLSVAMLRKFRQPVYWLCLICNIFGPIRILANVIPYLGMKDVNCDIVSYFINIPQELSLDAIIGIMMIKAYVAYNRNIIIPIISFTLAAGAFVIHFIHIFQAKYNVNPLGGCSNLPNPIIVMLWFGFVWAENAFLNAIFCYKILSVRTNSIFDALLRDGTIYLVVLTFSNIITPLLIYFRVFDSTTLFDIDWGLACFLISLHLWHCANMRSDCGSDHGNVGTTIRPITVGNTGQIISVPNESHLTSLPHISIDCDGCENAVN
ncbi:uncharacterized protein VTP21DRAFT_152 [Calcarisporiella thermophila]|uniref:uncharacterized protein n=1 Tax=Calcarisporiella thermophila TaxID=911321 RepID=UPI003743FDB1